MQQSCRRILFSFCFLLVVAFSPFFDGGADAAAGSLYTRCNIHIQNQKGTYKASYANYTNPGSGHIIIPAGSLVNVTKVTRKMIYFHVPDKNINVQFEFHETRMGMKTQEYLDKITSPRPVSYARLSNLDRKGIAEGKAFVGMSREGVMAALGYPAVHRTPSLDSPTYIYWTNRFGTMAVNFDAKGKVASIIN